MASVSPRQQLVIARRKKEAALIQRGKAQLAMLEAFERAAKEGIPKTEIAALAKVSRQTVYDILGK